MTTTMEQTSSQGVPRILLVEDEPRIRNFITRALVTAGYEVTPAGCGTEGLRLVQARDYDLVILDLIMPDIDGRLVLAQVLRERREQAVLVLSCLADVTTKVDCLELGAQDYLTKPFSLAELLARVRVRLRVEPHAANEVLKAGVLILDVGRLEANIGHGPVPLTRLEFLLLRELMEHAGQSVGKGQLLASVWGYDFDPGSNVVDVCVRRLRSKLRLRALVPTASSSFSRTSCVEGASRLGRRRLCRRFRRKSRRPLAPRRRETEVQQPGMRSQARTRETWSPAYEVWESAPRRPAGRSLLRTLNPSLRSKNACARHSDSFVRK